LLFYRERKVSHRILLVPASMGSEAHSTRREVTVR